MAVGRSSRCDMWCVLEIVLCREGNVDSSVLRPWGRIHDIFLRDLASHFEYRVMHELPWITIFFGHEWQKIAIHGNECIILFLTRYFMFWTHDSVKNNHLSLILPLSPRTVFSDFPLWRHHSRSVTSRELALWRHIRGLFLHVQIGTKAIFTSE